MTDTQQINASVLAEYLDVVKQLQATVKPSAKMDGNSLEKFAWLVNCHASEVIPNLDALRALVAEQEREQAEPRADISNCKTIADVSEAVNAFATQQIQQMATPIYTEPALRVGDIVRFTKSESPIRVWYEDGEIVSIVGDEFLCEGVRVIECKNNTTCQTVPLANLTLIERAKS